VVEQAGKRAQEGGEVVNNGHEGKSREGEALTVVHVVHTVLADQGEERLGGLLDGLVEGLRGGVAVLSEDLVLSAEHSLDTSHKLKEESSRDFSETTGEKRRKL
jgi:hypothetical protein